eukprot:1114711-Pleurochrysis_carterae.AAC.2
MHSPFCRACFSRLFVLCAGGREASSARGVAARLSVAPPSQLVAAVANARRRDALGAARLRAPHRRLGLVSRILGKLLALGVAARAPKGERLVARLTKSFFERTAQWPLRDEKEVVSGRLRRSSITVQHRMRSPRCCVGIHVPSGAGASGHTSDGNRRWLQGAGAAYNTPVSFFSAPRSFAAPICLVEHYMRTRTSFCFNFEPEEDLCLTFNFPASPYLRYAGSSRAPSIDRPRRLPQAPPQPGPATVRPCSAVAAASDQRAACCADALPADADSTEALLARSPPPDDSLFPLAMPPPR